MRIIYLRLCLMFFLHPGISAQTELPYNDTSYFVPFDEDFNLIMSASRGHLHNVQNLLDRGADINAVTIDNISALMYAAENGDFEMLRFLLTKGADPNMKPFNGITALISAARLNHQKIAEFLINNGANINASDAEGVTPVHYAAAYNYYDLVEMLLFYKANPNKADDDGNIPIVTAAYNNSLESMILLIEHGVDLNSKDKQGFTPLMVAISQDNKAIAGYLLEKDADVNIANDGGMTALAFAINEGNYAMAEKLIEKGANINHRINKSRNLLELAKEKNEDDIEELLILSGANPNFYPNFNRLGIGTGIQFNAGDFMNELEFSYIDTKYNTGIVAGFNFRPAAVRVKTAPENDTLFQYWERRYHIYAGLEKRFALIQPEQKIQSGPFATLNAVYTFGGYRGSSSRPDSRILVSPQLGWYFMGERVLTEIAYQYLDQDISNISPHRVNISLMFTFSTTKKKLLEKKVDWLNYD